MQPRPRSRASSDSTCHSRQLGCRPEGRRRAGTTEDDVRRAILTGRLNAGYPYRLNVEFKREWGGRYYEVQQIAPVVDEEPDRIVVITVFTFYYQVLEDLLASAGGHAS